MCSSDLRCRHTGFGEAVCLLARQVYDIAEIAELTPAHLEAAQARNRELRRPGERLRLLRDVANLDHVQVDNYLWECPPDTSGPDFFLYDLSWSSFCRGKVDAPAMYDEVSIAVEGIDSLRRAIEALFAKHGPLAIAVKSQHAYERTLLWEERNDADAERALLRQLGGEELSEGERLCLGTGVWPVASSKPLRTTCRSRSTPATTLVRDGCWSSAFVQDICARC